MRDSFWLTDGHLLADPHMACPSCTCRGRGAREGEREGERARERETPVVSSSPCGAAGRNLEAAVQALFTHAMWKLLTGRWVPRGLGDLLAKGLGCWDRHRPVRQREVSANSRSGPATGVTACVTAKDGTGCGQERRLRGPPLDGAVRGGKLTSEPGAGGDPDFSAASEGGLAKAGTLTASFEPRSLTFGARTGAHPGCPGGGMSPSGPAVPKTPEEAAERL